MVMKLKKLWHSISYTTYSMSICTFLQFLQDHEFLRQECNSHNLDEKNNEGKNTCIKSIDGQNRYHADHCGKHEELLWIVVHGPYIGLPNMPVYRTSLPLSVKLLFLTLNHFNPSGWKTSQGFIKGSKQQVDHLSSSYLDMKDKCGSL